ncbi:Protein of unknown function [Bacillus cytotoxicus]|uniref:Uncharacterized protein n=1 Tax=Bacillus cytotoxicus TaxID=580165 RepID=A0AAX2CCC8_9BACI|nr:Protein of unknown function [Bacillus cytotoxicus]SCN30722.1 Protein of unknown function [Bacillus cytotoxicus]
MARRKNTSAESKLAVIKK